VGTRPGRDACRGFPGRAPQAQSRHPTMAGGPGRGIRRHLRDVETTNGGDALPPHPGKVGHFLRRLAGPPPSSAPLSDAGQGQHWERKHPFSEPSWPGHWDFDTAETEIGQIFTETHQNLAPYGRCPASSTQVTPGRSEPVWQPSALKDLELEALMSCPPRVRSHLRDQRPRKKLPATRLPTLIALSPGKAWGQECYWSPL
jgi:hypothetical protein